MPAILTFSTADLEADEIDLYFYTDNSDADVPISDSATSPVVAQLNASTTVTANAGTDEITMAATIFDSGNLALTPIYDSIVRFTSSGTLPAPLAPATDYYVVVSDLGNVITLTDTGGTPIDITDVGTGVHTMILVAVKYVDNNSAYPDGYAAKDALVAITGAVLPPGTVANELFYVLTDGGFILLQSTPNYDFVYLRYTPGLDFDFAKIKNVAGWESVPPDHSFRSDDKVVLTNPNMGTLPAAYTEGNSYYINRLSDDKFLLSATLGGSVVPVVEGAGFVVGEYPLFHIAEKEVRAILVPDHGFVGGEQVQVTSVGVLPSPLAEGTPYWVVRISNDVFYLSSTDDGLTHVYIDADSSADEVDVIFPPPAQSGGAGTGRKLIAMGSM